MSADRLLRQSSLENLIESDLGGDQEMFNPVSVETSGDAEDLRHEIDEHVQRKKSLSLPPCKKYHLFISYSAEDREDANKICEHMEKRFQMKCMNFERDFVPGKSIDENISYEMQRSVKVLLILSPNYTQSHWCVTEAREACQLSFKDLCDVSVIPLLLRPLEKQLPPFLKSFVYIDAQKELDVPAKIYDAYLNPGSIDPLHKDRNGSSQHKSSGAFLCQKFASQTKILKHGFAYRFPQLDNHEMEKFATFDLEPLECATHYFDLIKDLNSRRLLRNYPLLVTKWRFLLLLLLTLTICCFFGGMNFVALQMEYSAVSYENPITTENTLPLAIVNIVGITLLLLLILCFFCCVPFCRKKMSASIHSVLLKHNRKFYKKSKCLVFFDDTYVLKPSLNIFKYDVTECQKYICLLLAKKRPTMTEDEIQTTADDMMYQKLRDLQMTNALIHWTTIPESTSRRHITRNNRACLCELVEESINISGPGPASTRQIIEV
ncbi:uncharacterized protein LOC128184489 [Crassostrea angulata]|uniref:uncharacterized protein LOC128184489 n=1 Tax=Magallana angulata TaxID=2784310 RepID=UPI0022B12341|nr:uncharacterized protein LOC128184489 [Crassostrea angulata]